MIDLISYILGQIKGKNDAKNSVIIESGITCVDDGNGNITITEDN